MTSDKRISSQKNEELSSKNFEELYGIGTRAYLDNDWDNCITYIEKSLEKYKLFQQSTARCKLKCKEMGRNIKPIYPENIEDLHFYEKMIKNTLCLLQNCEYLKEDIHKDVIKSFTEKEPYQYLQLCYYQASIPMFCTVLL